MPEFILRNHFDRKRAIDFLNSLDLDKAKVLSIKDDKRSDASNRKMWAMLRDVSGQVDWHGHVLSSEDWKHVFSAALQGQRSVPGVEGGFVVLGVSTRRQSQKWFSDLFELMNAFGAEHGVKWTQADLWEGRYD